MKLKSFFSLKGSRSLVRGIEAFFEVAVLAIMYYLVWRYCYQEGNFPLYLGKGKYVLMGEKV